MNFLNFTRADSDNEILGPCKIEDEGFEDFVKKGLAMAFGKTTEGGADDVYGA